MGWFRKLFKKKSGWVSVSHTITVPPGKWTVSQNISIKKGKIKGGHPIIKNFYEPPAKHYIDKGAKE